MGMVTLSDLESRDHPLVDLSKKNRMPILVTTVAVMLKRGVGHLVYHKQNSLLSPELPAARKP
jgi:hypothetical protein